MERQMGKVEDFSYSFEARKKEAASRRVLIQVMGVETGQSY